MNPKAPAPLFGSYFRETINGLSFGHTPGFTMQVGERVRWYLMASTNFEIHAPHWHGNVVQAGMMRTDVMSLLPMGMQVADMVPDNPGSWLIHCHVIQHLRMGMQAVYTVQPKASARAVTGAGVTDGRTGIGIASEFSTNEVGNPTCVDTTIALSQITTGLAADS